MVRDVSGMRQRGVGRTYSHPRHGIPPPGWFYPNYCTYIVESPTLLLQTHRVQGRRRSQHYIRRRGWMRPSSSVRGPFPLHLLSLGGPSTCLGTSGWGLSTAPVCVTYAMQVYVVPVVVHGPL